VEESGAVGAIPYAEQRFFNNYLERRAKRDSAGECGNPKLRGKPMKPEYDFSEGERGKFFHPNAELRLPVYLDADVQSYLSERAAQKGVPLDEMVNRLLKQEIQIIESVK
jgi:hypothetical protein